MNPTEKNSNPKKAAEAGSTNRLTLLFNTFFGNNPSHQKAETMSVNSI